MRGTVPGCGGTVPGCGVQCLDGLTTAVTRPGPGQVRGPLPWLAELWRSHLARLVFLPLLRRGSQWPVTTGPSLEFSQDVGFSVLRLVAANQDSWLPSSVNPTLGSDSPLKDKDWFQKLQNHHLTPAGTFSVISERRHLLARMRKINVNHFYTSVILDSLSLVANPNSYW